MSSRSAVLQTASKNWRPRFPTPIPHLEEKIGAQRHIKELEKKRNALRMNLYQAQDEVDVRKEKLIEDIEARLKQRLIKKDLFLIRWKVI